MSFPAEQGTPRFSGTSEDPFLFVLFFSHLFLFWPFFPTARGSSAERKTRSGESPPFLPVLFSILSDRSLPPRPLSGMHQATASCSNLYCPSFGSRHAHAFSPFRTRKKAKASRLERKSHIQFSSLAFPTASSRTPPASAIFRFK